MPTSLSSDKVLKKSPHFFSSIAALLLGMLASTHTAHATTYTWKGTTSGLLTTATNWIPSGIPTATDTILVSANSILTLNNDITISRLTLSPGSIVQGLGSITVTDYLVSQDALITGLGTLTVGPKATANISTASASLLSLKNTRCQKALVNQGTINLLSGSLVVANDVLNDTDATLNISSGTLTYNSLTPPLLENRGTILKSVSAKTSRITTDVLNTGIIRSLDGNLDLGDSFIQTAGTLSLDGGDISSDNPIVITGGKLAGTGVINGDVINSGNGHVGPGHSPGSIVINGNYTQTGNGSLDIEIGGTNPGTQFDTLTVNGNTSLGGMLNLISYNGYSPAEGSNFEILDYYSSAGNFASVNFQFPNSPLTLTTDLTPIYLVATATKPDSTLPTATVTNPTDNSVVTNLTSASGTASDANGIKSVTVQLYRYGNASTAPGFWAGGSTWSSSYTAATNERLATGTTNWSITLPTLAYGEYALRPTAKDGSGKSSLSDTVRFYKSAGTSSVALSTAVASSASDSIQLKFTGALDTRYAVDASCYDVLRTATGQPVSIQSISYNASTNTVTLNLLDGVLKAGDKITVSVSNMFDSTGKIISKPTAKIAAS